jgi:hypothetical protein
MLLLLDGGSQVYSYAYSGTGGVSLSGASLVGKGKTYVATGGTQSSGGGIYARAKAFVASGLTTISGAAARSKAKVYAAGGAIVSAGSALVSMMQSAPAPDHCPRQNIRMRMGKRR